MNKLTDKHREEILKEMFKRVGASYSEKFVQQKEWFQKYTWSIVEENDYKDWLTSYLVNNLKVPKMLAESSASFFIMAYGWKYNESNI